VDGVDDLGVVDALQVDGGDSEVGVSELTLDDHERYALSGHIDGVGVTQLVWCEASALVGARRRTRRSDEPVGGRRALTMGDSVSARG
jgi:hypothetical protein